MKKNIKIAIGTLILLLTVAVLSGCIQERYTIDEKGFGKDYYIDYDGVSYNIESFVVPIIGIIVIVVVIWIIYESWKDDKENKEKTEIRELKYDKELEDINKQLDNGKISEDTYKELRLIIDKKYKRKWYE